MNLWAFFNRALYRKLAAEALGTALLLATVVGSGIMGERLADGNAAIALLANSIATGVALFALITIYAPISGAHFNPVVTMIEAISLRMPRRQAPFYVAAQFAGAVIGVFIAHLMFELPLIHPSQHVRTGAAQWFSEFIATFGLLTVILHASKSRIEAVAAMVGCYITAAYWFTASTSFANPAVTFARSLTDTFAGIRMIDAPMFMLAQIAGALAAYFVYRQVIREH
ncbi:MAG: aquaporin family protein [Betaproteobacteria bacterium]|nr:aquaporin family protein [Betaproteobacteria bacterium]